MATTVKEVQMILRAKDMSSKPYQDVAASVDRVTKSLNDQMEAARRGESSASELTDSMKKLEQAGQALLKQQGVIDLYRKVGEQLQAASAAAEASRASYNELAATLASTENVTAKQQKSLAGLQKAADGADKRVATLTGTLATQSERLAQAGIDTHNLEAAQAALINTVQRTGTAMVSASEAIGGYNTMVREMRAAEALAAEENAFQKKLAQAQQLTKAGEYVNFWRNALDAADVAEREFAAENAFQKKLIEAQQLAKASEYVSFWRNALDSAEVAEKKLAEQNALDAKVQKELVAFRQLADQANATARGYTTLGDSSVKLAEASSQISPAIKSILDPTAAARDTLAGLETQIRDMATAIASINGPVADYTATMKSLQAAQRALSNQGELIDTYRQQMAAVRAAREEFVEARAQVLQYSAAIRAASEPSAELADGLKRAESALAGAQRQFQSMIDKARQTQSALREAGVSTAQLATEEERLTASARTSVSATDALATAYKRYGDAASSATGKSKSLNDSSRESLSWYQRVRGEVIALATAYIGLQGALGLAKGAIDAFISKQAVENRLAIVVGNDPTKIGQEWDYVHAQAIRLGVGIDQLADAYSRFGIAAKNGNLTTNQTRFAFERISEVLRVNHASTDQVSGAFYQLEQMLSKNRVQMDDLRQASNWIPGLETMMSKGLGMANVQQLFEAMKKGTVDAKTAILGLGEEMQREYGERVPASLKSLQAQQGRFQTGFSDFEREIANGGFADAYAGLLAKMTALLASDQGAVFAKNISDVFTSIVKVISSLIDHAGELNGLFSTVGSALGVVGDNMNIVVPLMEAAFGLKVLGWVRSLTEATLLYAQSNIAAAAGIEATAAAGVTAKAATLAVAEGSTIAAGAVNVLGVALRVVTRIFGIVGALLIAWDIGGIFYDKFAIVRKVVDGAVVEIEFEFKDLALNVERVFDTIGENAARLGTSIKNGILSGVAAADDGIRNMVGTAMKAAGMDPSKLPPSSGDAIRADIKPVGPAPTSKYDDQIAQNNAAWTAALANVNAGRKQDDDGKPKAKTTGPGQSELAAMDALAEKEKEVNAIVEARSKLIDDIRVKLAAGTITQKQAEDQTTEVFQSFGPQMKTATNNAIVFAKTLQGSLPLDKLENFYSKMEGLRGVYEPNLNANDAKMLAKQESLATQLSEGLREIDAKTERQNKDSLTDRLKAVDDTYQKMFVKVDAFRKAGGTTVGDMPIDTYAAQLNASKDVLKQQETAKFNTEQLAKKEQAVNDAIAQRNALLKSINDQVASGQITAAQGYEKSRATAATLAPTIKKLADDASSFANSLKGSGTVPDGKINAFEAKMGRVLPGNGGSSSEISASTIKGFEGFQPTAKYDVNAYRAGFGSSTVTLSDGTIEKVTSGMAVTLTDATRDLARRIGESQDGIKGQIGDDRFNSFSPQQQASLTSIAYNYGALPDRILGAVKTGTASQIADSIRGLAGDNNGVNAGRRNKEASMFTGGGKPTGTSLTSMMTGTLGSSAGADAGTGAAGTGQQNDAQAFIKKQYQDLNNVIQERNSLVSTYNALVQTGSITEQDAQTKIQAAYKQSQPAIQNMSKDMATMLSTMQANGDISSATFEKWSAQLQLVDAQSQKVDANFAKIKSTVETSITNGAVTAFDTLGSSIANAIDKTGTWGDVFKSIGTAALQFASDLLKQIANMILQLTIMNALKGSSTLNTASTGLAGTVSGGSSGGGFLGMLGALFGGGGGEAAAGGAAASSMDAGTAIAAIAHTGRSVGDSNGTSRSVPTSWFANAPRYHSGTVVGLKSDERTAILQTGEEVLSRKDPRNAMNGGGNAVTPPPAAPTPRIINVLDPSLVQDHLNSSAGETTLINVIKRNSGSIKQILNGA